MKRRESDAWEDGLLMPRRASRWRKWYLWSIALVLGGACFSPLMMSRKLLVLATPRRATIIQAPGEGEIRVAVPGEFVVCHEQRGFPISGYHSENRALSPRTTSVDVR